MAGKWWGTVNLPAVVTGPCNAPRAWHHGPAKAELRWIGGWLLAHEEHAERMEKERKERRGVAEMLVYIPPWVVLLSRHHPHHPPRILGPLSAALPAVAALGSWPAPAYHMHGFRHANGIELWGCAHECAGEFRESRWRQVVMADMTKWGFGEAPAWRSRHSILARHFFAWRGFVPSWATV